MKWSMNLRAGRIEMPILQEPKVGIISCSGEERPEGLASRLAALKVLHELRPGQTVTICLPLFLAGGQGDRAFAKLYPTIAVDGCDKRCAFRATEKYSSKPARGFIISEHEAYSKGNAIGDLRGMNANGKMIVKDLADAIARSVDELLQKDQGSHDRQAEKGAEQSAIGTCSCGSQVPVMLLMIKGKEREMVALPLIFEAFRKNKRIANEQTAAELLEQAGWYTPIPTEEKQIYKQALVRAYEQYLKEKRSNMITIKVLGIGCENCKKVEANTMDALAELNIDADVQHITEHAAIYAYPIMGTPGLVINEKVVSAGRIPSKDEIKEWLKQAA
jgi:small redox-active disulfide protein 2